MKILVCIALFSISLCMTAQFAPFFEHFSTDDGLPQNVVTDIIQDRKGFIWVSTWNGFARFDGHRFKQFTLDKKSDYSIGSSRFEHLYEDKLGYIWLESYDNKAHRFDPSTETFTGLNALPAFKNKNFRLSKISVQPSGRVWLISARQGCICVLDSAFNVLEFNSENYTLYTDEVLDVYEDADHSTWILSGNGLYRIRNNSDSILPYFYSTNYEDGSNPFYCFVEMEDEIWFGSSKGQIWMFHKENEIFKSFKLPINSSINGLYQTATNELTITTSGDGLFVLDCNRMITLQYIKENSTTLKDNVVQGNYVDQFGQLWFQTRDPGLYKLNTKNQQIKYYQTQVEDAAINVFPSGTKIKEDVLGRLWVHPRGGGFSFYDHTTESLVPFNSDEYSKKHPFSNILHSLFSDQQGNLWFCSRSLGLEKVSFNNPVFKRKWIDTETSLTNSNNVRAVLQDDENRIWMATKEGRIVIYSEDMTYLGDLSASGRLSKKEHFGSMIYCMMMDSSRIIWLGSKTDGLFKVAKSKHGLMYEIENFRKDENNALSLSENVIYSIYQDSKNRIWVGTYGGGLNLITYSEDNRIFFLNQNNSLSDYPKTQGSKIRVISEDDRGIVYVGTTNGLIVFPSDFMQPEDIPFTYIVKQQGLRESLSNNDVHDVCVTSKGEVFLTTFGGGLNKVDRRDPEGLPQTFVHYEISDGLPSNVCLSAIEDNEGEIWISTEANLTRFNPLTQRFKVFPDIRKLMRETSFSESTRLSLVNHDLIFGLTEGFLHFNPESIQTNLFKPYMAFVDFKIENQSVYEYSEGSVLKQSIDYTQQIILRHDQHSFSFEFAALDYTHTRNIQYAYMLAGFDKSWVYAQNQRTATYTNIPRGMYVFRVRSTNSDGIWVDNERSISVTVLPSFWESPMAFFLYFIVFIILFIGVFRVLFTFYRMKKNVEIEKQLSEIKINFFTDISHEIRTPLTMIAGPIEYLLKETALPEKYLFHLKLISQNTQRMLRLVNQILDFRKTQEQILKVQETDPADFTKNVFDGFTELANRHNIRFTFIDLSEGEKIWVDRGSLEIILMNLFSNAFKYTPDQGEIEIKVMKLGDSMLLSVKDSGHGISKENHKNVFKRFVRYGEDASKPSTGIGLSVVKDLVERHKGRVLLDSKLGRGSTFTVVFPLGLNHYDKNDVVVMDKTGEENAPNPLVSELNNTDTSDHAKPKVLLVEDDADLRRFIAASLENSYLIIEAEHGEEGYEKVIQLNPDIVVSDVMMPVMDGIDLLRKIKTTITSSHIPVILLTAKTMLEHKLEGLENGADDYIIKPFSISYLRTRISNLLEQRKRLQHIYQTQFDSESFLKVKTTGYITSRDELFMKSTIELIEKTMDDSDVVIDDLVCQLGMSRSVFYTKIKSLTGLSPIEFIKDIKLQRAAQLLASGEYMIKEVACMIGFLDLKYFRELFKAKFGVSPSEYRNRTKTE